MKRRTLVMQDRVPSHFFVCLLATLFLAIFYNTVTNMAGLYIVSDLGGSNEISVYPMVFFGLGNALSIPLANPLADRIGPIKLLVNGLLLYTLFSILCAVAPTFFIFNLFRLGLGLASGLFYILCRRLLIAFSPPEKLERYTFVMIIMYVVVPVLGACFGAWLAYEEHWEWIFHVNEPVSLFLAAYFWFLFRNKDPASMEHTDFDKIGYFFFCLGISCLITAATVCQELDWYRSPVFLILIMLGGPSLLFFILRSVHIPKPLLELRLLKSPLLSYSLLNLAILFSAYFGMIILIALWLNIYVNYSPLWIAVLLCAMLAGGVAAYFVTKDLLRRFDPRFTLALAIIAFASSCYYSTYFDVDVDFFHLGVARFLAGMGLGLFLVPVLNLSLKSYGPEQSTPIFTLFQVVRSCSSSLGAGLYVVLWQRRQVFFHERLGENLNVYSTLTKEYFQRAADTFNLTKEQAVAQLNVFLDSQATSLALNDAFGFMGYILLGLLLLLILSFLVIPRFRNLIPTQK
jgi:MFS transporter, DHA2 family, multidrug resistance protein